MAPGLAEGRPAILASDPDDPTSAVRWVILLDWKDGEVAAIRDFHYADYVVDGLALTRL
jgi:RNA polymerase sigma-70 factor (ECF subfamily)